MTPFDLNPDLERLGDALRAATTVDLAGNGQTDRADRSERGRAGFLRRPRVLAGGTLGLAGIGTALVLALTAGGAAAPPAFAITTNSNGTLTVNLSKPGDGLFPLNNKLAKMGYNEHIQFTMAQGPATSPGIINCVSTPQGATVSGPAINVTVGPDTSNTETIASGNTGAGTWHVASCQRFNGAQSTHFAPGPNGSLLVVPGASGGDSSTAAHVKGARRPLVTKLPSRRHASAQRDSSTAPVALNLDTDGGLVGANRTLAAQGTDEHIEFTMAQGPAAASGVVNCTPASASVAGPAVTVTVGSGDSNTETIAAGNTGAGTWHVASCTRYSGTGTASLPVEG